MLVVRIPRWPFGHVFVTLGAGDLSGAPNTLVGVAEISGAQAVRWTQKGILALADQALFAGTNFLVHILLARWLSAGEYGSFAVAQSAILFVAAVHNGAIVEPMAVFGAGKYADRFHIYLGRVLLGQAWIAGAAGLIVSAVGLGVHLLGGDRLGSALIGAGLAAPLLLTLRVVRCATYLPSRPAWAVSGGVLYLGLVLTIIGIFHGWALLSPLTSFLALGGGAALAVVWLIERLAPSLKDRTVGTTRDVLTGSWEYGRWGAGVGVLIWVNNNVYYLIVATAGGLEAAGTLRAVFNIYLPFQHVVIGLGTVLLPALSRRYWSGGMNAVHGFVIRGAVGLGLLAVGYVAFVGLGGPSIMRLVYAGTYDTHGGLLLLGLPLPLLWAWLALCGNALRAMGRPRALFVGYSMGGAVVLILAVVVIPQYGVSGALITWSVGLSVTTAAMLWQYARLSRSSATRGPGT